MKQTVHIQYYNSPCGKIILASVGDALCLCDWSDWPCAERNKHRLARCLDACFTETTSAVLENTRKQLDEYFAGARKVFDVKIRPVGTAFQQQVWKALCDIPYGQTRTYMDVARKVNNSKGVRAVAQAIGANGICIVIPCHRVIGSDRSLTGFAGGLDAKRLLLKTESQL